MTRVPLVAALVAGALPTFAIAQHAPPRVRDSAGVRIVEHTTIRTDQPAFRVTSAPIARVGGLRDNPQEEIENTGYQVAVRLANGNIAVAENYTVRVLAPSGGFVRRLGGRGSGPGEFDSQIVGLCVLPNDGLLVIGGSRRASVFDSTGRLVRAMATESYAAGHDCGPDGSMLGSAVARSTLPPEARSAERNRARVFHLDSAGKIRDTIGEFAAGIGRPPFAVIQDGLHVATHGDRLIIGDGSTAEVQFRAPDGRLVGILRWKDPLVPVTPALIEKLADLRIPLTVTGSARAAQVAEVRAQRHRDSLPAYGDLRFDAAGRIWVRDFTGATTEWPDGYRPAWTVFSADGLLLGRFQPAPVSGARVMVTAIGRDYVVVRASSRDEGVSVLVYGITPASGQ